MGSSAGLEIADAVEAHETHGPALKRRQPGLGDQAVTRQVTTNRLEGGFTRLVEYPALAPALQLNGAVHQAEDFDRIHTQIGVARNMLALLHAFNQKGGIFQPEKRAYRCQGVSRKLQGERKDVAQARPGCECDRGAGFPGGTHGSQFSPGRR